jgi:DNA-binding MarR family transcriptional regulator
MADATRAAAAFLDFVPQMMCNLRTGLAESGSGLSIPQFRCLKMVHLSRDVSLGDLADANGVSAPAMSKLVDGLVDAGLLERRPSADDRRRVELSLTSAGRRKLEAVADRLRAALAASLSSFPAPDLAVLERTLRHLNMTQPLVTA